MMQNIVLNRSSRQLHIRIFSASGGVKFLFLLRQILIQKMPAFIRSLGMEYTLPGISQSVILTRMEGRTGVPEKESVESFAAHQATMVLFLSSSMIGELAKRLVDGGYTPQTPAAIVYKATWPEEKVFVCTVGSLEKTAAENGITRTALIIVGEAVRYNGLRGGGGSVGNTGPTGNTGLDGSGGSAGNSGFERSRLYDADFTTGYRIRRPQE